MGIPHCIFRVAVIIQADKVAHLVVRMKDHAPILRAESLATDRPVEL